MSVLTGHSAAGNGAAAASISAEGALSSVANAARLLREFGVDRPDLGVSELARRLGIGKSTAHRLVTTLVREQLLEQDPATGRYRLSIVVHHLGLAVPMLRNLHPAAAPVVEAVRARTKETVVVGVRRGHDILTTERSDSGFGMMLFRRHGPRAHAHCSAVGKALLADLAPAAVDELLAGWTPMRYTAATIVEPAALRRELDAVRRRGYAVCQDETEVGTASVGAAIRESVDGPAIAGLAVILPTARLTPTAQRNLGSLVVEAANTITTRLDSAENSATTGRSGRGRAGTAGVVLP